LEEKKEAEKGKRTKLGPVIPERSTRIANDGRASLEKAKQNKKKEDLDDIYRKGKTSKHKNSSLSKKIVDVSISIGVDTGKTENIVDNNLNISVEFSESRMSAIVNEDDTGVR
jgi:hypothetical protein